ncbi:MAG: YitT family protein [Bacilli bacterium]|nr:YitT family protein [Bacilli bacterium]
MDKKLVLKQTSNYIAVILGTFLLSFGSVIFLTKAELVAGGISGIAIIIQHFVDVQIYDYLVAGLTVFFWLLGLIFVGKDFALKTALSSALYIGFTFLFKRVAFFDELAITFAGEQAAGNLILCGIFGGVFIGGGVAITFLGGGSTGGVDVVQVLLSKYAGIKESISSFMIDGLVIVVGMATMQLWVAALCGILSSFVTAVLIEIVYIKNQTAYQVDIISDKWEDISRYAQDELERGATIIRAEGGYKGEERVILRVVFDKMQYEKIKRYIASVDPKAFVTYTQTNAVFGEGFKKHTKKNKKVKK